MVCYCRYPATSTNMKCCSLYLCGVNKISITIIFSKNVFLTLYANTEYRAYHPVFKFLCFLVNIYNTNSLSSYFVETSHGVYIFFLLHVHASSLPNPGIQKSSPSPLDTSKCCYSNTEISEHWPSRIETSLRFRANHVAASILGWVESRFRCISCSWRVRGLQRGLIRWFISGLQSWLISWCTCGLVSRLIRGFGSWLRRWLIRGLQSWLVRRFRRGLQSWLVRRRSRLPGGFESGLARWFGRGLRSRLVSRCICGLQGWLLGGIRRGLRRWRICGLRSRLVPTKEPTLKP